MPAGIGKALLIIGEKMHLLAPGITPPSRGARRGRPIGVRRGKPASGRACGLHDVELKVYPELFHEVFNEPERDRVLDDVVEWIQARL